MNDQRQQDQIPDFPYPGIDPYGYTDRNLFFVRESEVRSLIRLIVMYRCVLLYSDSGTGKSSLVNAGLIPLAVAEGYQPERLRVRPRTGEEIVVERLSEKVEGKQPFLPSIFTEDEHLSRVLLSIDDFLTRLHQYTGSVRPLLIFDQFEEWVTLFDELPAGKIADEARTSKEKILNAIVEIVNDTLSPVKVLIVLREDYLAKLAPFFERLPSLADQYLRLTAIKSDQIYKVIRGPFEKYQGRFERELSDDLAKGIKKQFDERAKGGDIRLAEVQITCSSLFESGKHGEDLFAEKGVRGILEHYMENSLASLDPEQRGPAIALLSRMVTSAGTRNVISRDDLLDLVRVDTEDRIPPEVLGNILDSLEKTKLVRRELHRDIYYYEIASEFLIDWIRKKDTEQQHLLEERKLRDAQHRIEEQMQRADKEARTAKRFRYLGIVLFVMFIFAVGLGIVAFASKREADLRKGEADLRALISNVYKNLSVDPELSSILALYALENAQSMKNKELEMNAFSAFDLAVHASRVKSSFSIPNDKNLDKAAFNHDGSMIAFTSGDVSDTTAKIYKVNEKKFKVLKHSARVNDIVFSKDGRYVATASEDKIARIWDSNTGGLIKEFPHNGPVIAVAFDLKGRRVATGSLDKARIWDINTGKEIQTKASQAFSHLNKDESLVFSICSVAFSPDGKNLATGGYDKKAIIWDIATGRKVHILSSGHTDLVTKLIFSPDGKKLATVSYRKVIIWDTSSGKLLQVLRGHTNTVFDITFSGDSNQIATASADTTARVWSSSSGQLLFTLNGHDSPIAGISYLQDNKRLATADWNKMVKQWNVTPGHMDAVSDIAYSPDGKYLASASYDKTAIIWDAKTGLPLRILDDKNEVTGIRFHPGGKRLTTATADRLTIWEPHSGKKLRELKLEPDDSIETFDISPMGNYVAAGSVYGKVTLWDLKTYKRLKTLAHDGYGIRHVAFDPREKYIVVSSDDNKVVLWNMKSWEKRTLEGHDNFIYKAAFSPDGEYIATAGSDNRALLWDRNSGEKLEEIGHKGQVVDVTFSPDNRFLATASLDKTACIYEIATMKEKRRLVGHGGPVGPIAFNKEGNLVSTASWDRTAKVWDTSSGKVWFSFSHRAEVTAVTFSPDSAHLATGGEDKTVRIHPLSSDGMRELAKKRITRQLTSEECKEYLDKDKCPPLP